MHDEVGIPSERYRSLVVAAGIVALVVLSVLAVVAAQPPRAERFDVPPDVFSARRAAAHVQQLAGNGLAHPTGAPPHAFRRERVIAALAEAGLPTTTQSEFVCSPRGNCAEIHNIVGVIDGSAAGRSVILTAHYDSVPAGPGASDDIASVGAIVEITRILLREKGRNRVVILITDGEELGLLGATAFSRSHPEAKRLGAVVNLEARGTEGPSYLFETSRDNARLVDLARRIPRPATSSVFYSIYERLPNDTDFSVYKRAGNHGVNFAFIRGAARYHTPQDSLAYLSLASLQHQGDNALAITRALRDADLTRPKKGNAIFFDVFSVGIISWPERWAIPLLIAVLLLMAAAVWRQLKRGTLQPASLLFGLLCAIAALVASVALGWIATQILHWSGALGGAWTTAELAARAAFAVGGVASVLLAGIFVARYAGPIACWAAVLTIYTLLTTLTTLMLPGASYLTLFAALVLSLCGFVYDAERARVEGAMIPIAIVASGIPLFPLAFALYDALGAPVLVASSAMISLVAMPLLIPLAATTRPTAKAFAWTFTAISVGFLIVAALGEPYSEALPRHQNLLVHHDADRGTTEIVAPKVETPVVGPLRSHLREVPSPFVWTRASRHYAAPLPVAAALSAPEVRLVASSVDARGRRTLRLALRSLRGAERGQITFHDEGRIESVTANGWRFDDLKALRSRSADGWTRIAVATLANRELFVDVTLRDTYLLSVIALDQSFGLPKEATELAQIRDHYAVPVQEGDVTVVSKRFAF
ncbi:MAG: M28 family peptidase [Thermoanaerobaculia bacterium]